MANVMAKRKKILLTGGTGFIGSNLTEYLVKQGYHVTVLARSAGKKGNSTGQIDFVQSLSELQNGGWYGVINLAGEPLDRVRWSIEQKELIIKSRVTLTCSLNEWIQNLNEPPAVLISGSAVGWYGHWDDECLDESSPSHEGFSNKLCAAWESAAYGLVDLECRICIVRLGIVLGDSGGSLPAMLLPAKLGLSGPMGNGMQWWSWIHIADTVRSITMLLEDGDAAGVFNLTAPNPVTQKTFARALGKQLNRPSFMPLPEFAAKLMLGEFAEEVLLRGQRVLPRKLLDAGFKFDHPSLPEALNHLL
jgi:uncharacterized protein (TIGR01777 family)